MREISLSSVWREKKDRVNELRHKKLVCKERKKRKSPTSSEQQASEKNLNLLMNPNQRIVIVMTRILTWIDRTDLHLAC